MGTGVALVIPAWNEPESIGALLGEVPRDQVDHVLVVVGGPGDPTSAVAQQYGARVVVPERRGYGAACFAGAAEARALGAEIAVFLDGDYSDPPQAMGTLVGLLRAGADLSLGCRDFTRHPGSLPLHARLGNYFVARVMHLLIGGPRLVDLPSFKAIRLDRLNDLAMQEMTYGWTVEMLAKSLRSGFAIAQVQVPYRPRFGGQSKVSGSVRGSAGAAWKLLSCAVRYARWNPVDGRLA